MNLKNTLYLTVHAHGPAGAAMQGSEALDEVKRIDEQLIRIGWRRALAESVGDAEFYADLCAFGFATGADDARRAIARLTQLLALHRDQVRAEGCLIRAWQVGERSDRLQRGLTVTWSRATGQVEHDNVVMLRPRWTLTA